MAASVWSALGLVRKPAAAAAADSAIAACVWVRAGASVARAGVLEGPGAEFGQAVGSAQAAVTAPAPSAAGKPGSVAVTDGPGGTA